MRPVEVNRAKGAVTSESSSIRTQRANQPLIRKTARDCLWAVMAFRGGSGRSPSDRLLAGGRRAFLRRLRSQALSVGRNASARPRGEGKMGTTRAGYLLASR